MKNRIRLLLDIYFTFFKLGAFSFGGGYAMIPLIEREAVEVKKWVKKEEITDIFAIAECLPGAIALNSSAFTGYSVAKISGALAALAGNLTPSVIIVLTLNILYDKVSGNPYVEQIFLGIRPAIVGLIAYAAVKIGRTAIKDIWTLIIAGIAFILALFLHMSPIQLIIIGAITGNIITTIKSLFVSKRGGKVDAF